MITHLLNLYSTLLGLRRKKKGEVFRPLLLLLPPLPPLSPRRSLPVCILKCLPLSLRRAYFAFPFVYRLVRSNLYRSIPPFAALFALANKKKKKERIGYIYALDSYNLFRNVVYRRSA